MGRLLATVLPSTSPCTANTLNIQVPKQTTGTPRWASKTLPPYAEGSYNRMLWMKS